MNAWLGLFVVSMAFIDGLLVGLAIMLPKQKGKHNQ